MVLAAILLIAVFLRGHYLLQIEHNVDHAYPVWQALSTLEHGIFPLAGQGTSVLFANPAFTGYLYLPVVALTRSPLGAYVLVIALNTLGVLLAFRAARGLLGVHAALVATFLLAVNPWVIEYSRTSWVQSLLPFFACALAWLLWPLLLGRSSRPFRRTILALVILTLYTQTYLLAFLALVPVGLLILIFRRNIPIRALLIGGGVFALAILLYTGGLVGQIETVGARVGEFSGSPRRLSPEAWNHAVRLVTGEDYEIARGTQAPPYDSALRHDLTCIAHIAVYAALIVGIGLAVLSLVFSRRTRYISSLQSRVRPSEKLSTQHSALSTLLLLWFIPPILLMSYVGQPVHPFYQLLGLPAGHILAAWGLTAVLPARRWGNAILLVLAIPFGVLMGVNSSRYYQETAAAPGAEYLSALSLEYGLQLGRAIDDNLPPGGVVFADTDEWILNSFTGRTFPVIRDMRLPNLQIIPQSGALVVQMSRDAVPDIPYATRVNNLILPDGWYIMMDLYAPGTTPVEGQPRIASEQGITFLGYELAQDGAQVELTSFWQVESLTPNTAESLFAPFIHVFDTNGGRVLIVDGQAVPGYQWQVGDIHVHWMAFDLPDEGAPFSLQIGQYDSAHNLNVIFLPDFTPTIPLTGGLRD